MPSGHCAFSRRPFCVRRPTAKAEALADAGPGRGFIAPHRCCCPVHRHLRCEPATIAVSRHISPRRASRTRARLRHRRFSRDIAASWSGDSYRCETPAFLGVSTTHPRHKPLSALTLKRHNACAFGICTARRLICRQVLPRAKSGFAQFDMRVNDFTALSDGSGCSSYIFR